METYWCFISAALGWPVPRHAYQLPTEVNVEGHVMGAPPLHQSDKQEAALQIQHHFIVSVIVHSGNHFLPTHHAFWLKRWRKVETERGARHGHKAAFHWCREAHGHTHVHHLHLQESLQEKTPARNLFKEDDRQEVRQERRQLVHF